METRGAKPASSLAGSLKSRRFVPVATAGRMRSPKLIGHALGGRPGERLMGRIGLAISDDTILRRLKKCARKPASGTVVGLDDGRSGKVPSMERSWWIWKPTR